MNLKYLKEIASNRISAMAFITQDKLNDSFRVKAKGLIVGTFARMLPAIGLGTTKYRLSIIVHLIKRFSVLYKKQGMKGLVIHLKATTTILQQSLAGFKLRDMTGLNTRIARGAGGLPRMIPNQDRLIIAKGRDPRLLRFYLTIFNLYRILEFPGKVKLGSITSPFAGNKGLRPVYDRVFADGTVFGQLVTSLAGNKLSTHGISMSPILKASPGSNPAMSSSHPMTLLIGARTHKEQGTDAVILYFAKYFEKNSDVRYPGFARIFQKGADMALNLSVPSNSVALGKLGLKQEPAGKVRVFAMVDAWTNWALEPLHKEIFRILKHFPADGTFDQIRPVLNYTAWPSAYSLDLTAATDRLPLSLQIHILSILFGKEFALNWARLLVEREYEVELRYPDGGLPQDTLPTFKKLLKYAVGQPMGALSSWAMLALTHHYIVHAAAWQSGLIPYGKLYDNYAILGDDLVIGDRLVKDCYLTIVDALGVECGLHKSVLSTRGVGIEFAKRTFFKGIDVSPVPILEFISATWTLPAAIAFGHKYKLTLPQLVKTMGFGYKVLGGLDRHVGQLSRKVRMLLMAFNAPPITSTDEEISAWLGKGNPLVGSSSDAIKAFETEVIDTVEKLIKKAFAFNVSTYIKEQLQIYRVGLTYSNSFSRYLTSIIGRGEESREVVLYDRSKAFRMWKMITTGTVKVPPSVFNRIKEDILDWDLWVTQVLSNQVGPQVANSRDTINRLQSDMTRLGPQNRIPQSYVYSLQALKEINNTSVITQFKRVDDELRPRMDVVQIKL